MPDPRPAWLLLVQQLPAKPSRARVQIWRRLQNVGAVSLRGAVWALPNTPEAREDLEWVRSDVLALGGHAAVLAAEAVDGVSAEEVATAVREAREQDYAAIDEAARALLAGLGERSTPATRRRLARKLAPLRERLRAVVAVDPAGALGGAPGRDQAEAALSDLEARLRPAAPVVAAAADAGPLAVEALRGRTWVTRPRPGVDRMATAWLVRRFVDPAATFVFAEHPEDRPAALPFDMYGVDFGHHEGRCTFETLALRLGLDDPAVAWLGRLVHDVDLKDARYAVPEGATVARLIEGLQRSTADDGELLARGIELFEALYRSPGA